MIKPPLYEEIQQLAFDIVFTSSSEDTESQWTAYIKLRELCEANENTEFNHPLQWEALGDFTSDDTQAIIIYKKALKYAEENKSLEHLASTYLALAERHYGLNDLVQAFIYANKAKEAARSINDLGLKKEISEFFLIFSKKI